MLIQKKISTKKLAIYLSIIFFMISGTGFMLYQNKNLTSHRLTNVNIPIVFSNSTSTAPAATGEVDARAAAGAGQASDTSEINQNGGLDLTIFSSDKFKMLKEGELIIKEPSEVGKRDPFKPN